ncbi:hypothetical protein B0O99DRAFT_642446 [Bisporella sp. PMI_857]|nr:hypothetical protein B0O99DRAFT_642446 [Bisporella sp. PMI_857]
MPISLASSGRLSKKIDMRWIVGIGLLVISFASPWSLRTISNIRYLHFHLVKEVVYCIATVIRITIQTNTFLLSLSRLGNWSRRKRAIHVVFYKVTFFSCCIAFGHLISRARLAPLI